MRKSFSLQNLILTRTHRVHKVVDMTHRVDEVVDGVLQNVSRNVFHKCVLRILR
uniref:Uncharacterized protein n=1 Tax=Cryptophlebia leucotreta granulosis virus TaxID=35254 RepID=A0A2H4ZKL0_GVCL|nr:hypothetical protein [Cryptophlebia leucotreta granulovirus]